MTNTSNESLLNSPEFKKIVRSRWIVSLSMTIVMLTVYVGFLLLVAFYKPFLATKISTGLTVAIPLGIGILIFTWIMTGIYVYWANTIYDAQIKTLKEKTL